VAADPAFESRQIAIDGEHRLYSVRRREHRSAAGGVLKGCFLGADSTRSSR
jgi:hypothetical protein